MTEGATMVIYAPQPARPHQETRLHPQRSRSAPDIALVRDDLYVVFCPDDTMGFVERVGNVFVALSGPNMNHAVEIGQSLSYDQAVHMVHYRYLDR
jgi:hypothetical protein